MTAPDPRPALPPRPSQMAGDPAARPALPPRPSQMAGPASGAAAPTAYPALPPRPSQMAGDPAARPALPPRPSAAPPAAGPVGAQTRDARPPLPPRPATVARSRPDPRPMRLGLGAAAIAALSIMAAGLVRFPVSAPAPVADDTALAQGPVQNVTIQKKIRYVQLKPGQKAPPGARVIEAAAPTPRVIVNTIQAAPRVVHRTVTTRTRQSGHP